MSWQTFPHEADVGVRGCGATLAEAFAGAATALTSVVCAPAEVVARESVAITCRAPDRELLLVDWLNALIYEMATRHLLFSRFEVAIAGGEQGSEQGSEQGIGRELTLKATVFGEAIDVARHQPAAEAKGASFCELRVARADDGSWCAQCVVDV
ncbi:archease [Rhodocyclus purpureus]|nr:archease [Rhodocyclus purpureus]